MGGLKPPCRVHAAVQNADNGNAGIGYLEIDDMMLDAAPAIARPDMAAALRLHRRFGQLATGRLKGQRVAIGLLLSPLPARIMPDFGKVALG